MKKRTNKNNLTPEQQKFADEWLIHNNGQWAYKKAYGADLSDETARASASRLLIQGNVVAYIEKEQAKIAEKYKITRERVLEEEARIAFADPIELCNEDGTLKQLTEMPEAIRRVVSKIENELSIYGKDDNEREVTKTRYHLIDKGRALERIEKHLGMFEKDNQQKRPSLEEVYTAIANLSPELGEAIKEQLEKKNAS